MEYSRRDFNRMSALLAGATLLSTSSLARSSSLAGIYDSCNATALAAQLEHGPAWPTHLPPINANSESRA